MRFPTIFRRRIGEPDPGKRFLDVARFFEDISPADGLSLKGKLIPELGSDKVPSDPQSLPRRDNLHESRLVNVNGFPSQRICVGYQGPQGAPSLIAEMHLFDETSSSWFLVPPCKDDILEPGKLTYFDPPCLLDHSRAKKHPEDESHQSGSLEVLLIVRAETSERVIAVDKDGFKSLKPVPKDKDGFHVGIGDPVFPDGVYTFVIGTDVSNPG